MGKTFNPEKLNPTPYENSLLKAAEDINKTLRSRAHLLSIIDGLDLSKTSLEVRMVYVLAMLNLGFSKARSLKRLSVTKGDFYKWKDDEENATRLDECIARGGLILEETLLLAAENNPKIALEVLKLKDKEDSQEEQFINEKKKSVEAFFYESLKERGLIQDAQIVEDKAQEGVPDELR